MKTSFTVTCLVLYAAWTCQANPTNLPTVSEIEANSTEIVGAAPLAIEKDVMAKEAPLSAKEVLVESSHELENNYEIEPESRPTKKHKRPQNPIRRTASDQPLGNPMAYYPAPAPMAYAMPYSQCPYNQPFFYPPNMYPSYPYPTYNPFPFAEQTSPNQILKDSSDTTEVVNVSELLRIASLWQNNLNKTALTANKTSSGKPQKQFLIHSWIKNKASKLESAFNKA